MIIRGWCPDDYLSAEEAAGILPSLLGFGLMLLPYTFYGGLGPQLMVLHWLISLWWQQTPREGLACTWSWQTCRVVGDHVTRNGGWLRWVWPIATSSTLRSEERNKESFKDSHTDAGKLFTSGLRMSQANYNLLTLYYWLEFWNISDFISQSSAMVNVLCFVN